MGDLKSKVFITGASGLLGRKVVEEACKRNFDVVGIAFSRAQNNLIKCDLTKDGEVEKLLDEIKPNFIVHAAAERLPDRVENDYEGTKLLNIETSRRLGKKAKEIGSKIIYISTDYVFDGTSPPYQETDTPNPLNKYGETKLEGEKAILVENPDALVLRIPILYGPVEKLEESAINSLLSCLLTLKNKSVSHYEKRYPAHTQDIANIVCDLMKVARKDASLKGIFQWSGKEMLTKYDVVLTMSKVFSLSHDHITPDSNPTAGAPRPYDAQMTSSRLESLGISSHIKFEEGIKECLAPWVSRKND